LNEGCEGGWSMFNGYLAENGHFVTEECGPYKATTKGAACSAYESCAPAAKIEKSYFIEASQVQNSVPE